MRAGTFKQVLLGAGIALGIAAGGCYGDYAGTTSNGGGSGSGSDGGSGSGNTANGTGSGTGGGSIAPNHPDGGAPTMNTNTSTAPGCMGGATPAFVQDVSPTGQGMSPGEACISCHSSIEGPRFYVAGTVYPTAHESTNCAGISAPTLTVVISDSAGHIFSLPTTTNGNFGCGSKARSGFPACVGFTAPYAAYVLDSTSNTYRAMGATQTSGDCNTCHTAAGGGGGSTAPGRIMAP